MYAPCRIRTCGPLLRRQLLYPAELREQSDFWRFGRRAGRRRRPNNENQLTNITYRRSNKQSKLSDPYQSLWISIIGLLPASLSSSISLTFASSTLWKWASSNFKAFSNNLSAAFTLEYALFFGFSAISTQAFDLALRAATLKANIEGFSSHGFRRSSLTAAHNNNVPLNHLRSVSGHQSLHVLQEYLAVNDKQKRAVVDSFA